MVFRRGGEDGTIGLSVEVRSWSGRDGALRARAEGPEPLGEIYAAGLRQVLMEGPALENFVLIDLVAAADERDALRPLLACAISGKAFAD